MQRGALIPCDRIGRALIGGWLVVWILFSSLLASSPALHLHFHENAAQQSHQCAVTLLEQQQLLSGEPQIFLFALDFSQQDSILPATLTFHSHCDIRLDQGRAPPVLS